MATGVLDQDSSSVHHDEDHNNKRLLLNNLFVDDNSSVVIHVPVAKSVYNMPPKKRLIWENSLFDDDGAPLAKSSLFTTNYYDNMHMPPKKRLRREELEEEDSSAYDIIHAPNTKSAFSLWPKQSLTSKEHSSADINHTPVTRRCLCYWPIKTRRTSKNLLKNTEYVEGEEDDYYALKIQKLIEEMRDKFDREKGLATKKVKKICRYDVEIQQKKKKNKKIKKEKLPTNETDDHNNKRNLRPATDEDQLKRFVMGEEINGTDMRLVIQKKLFETDLKRDQNRLSMPIKKLETNDFLTVEEKKILKGKANVTPGIEVRLVGPKLEMFKKPMRLKLWEMRNNKNFVLITNWSDFVDDNKEYLQKERVIRVWSFRKDDQLCFAISVV